MTILLYKSSKSTLLQLCAALCASVAVGDHRWRCVVQQYRLAFLFGELAGVGIAGGGRGALSAEHLHAALLYVPNCHPSIMLLRTREAHLFGVDRFELSNFKTLETINTLQQDPAVQRNTGENLGFLRKQSNEIPNRATPNQSSNTMSYSL